MTIVQSNFIKGRMNFDFERNLKGANAPFPSMLVHLRQSGTSFRPTTG